MKIQAKARLLVTASDWWDRMPDAKKKAYIKTHPNSKYAKESGASGLSNKKSSPAKKSNPVDSQRARLEKLREEYKEIDKKMNQAGNPRKGPLAERELQLREAIEDLEDLLED